MQAINDLVVGLSVTLHTSENFDCNSHNLGAVGFIKANSPSDGPLIDITISPLTQFVFHNDLTRVEFPVLSGLC